MAKAESNGNTGADNTREAMGFTKAGTAERAGRPMEARAAKGRQRAEGRRVMGGPEYVRRDVGSNTLSRTLRTRGGKARGCLPERNTMPCTSSCGRLGPIIIGGRPAIAISQRDGPAVPKRLGGAGGSPLLAPAIDLDLPAAGHHRGQPLSSRIGAVGTPAAGGRTARNAGRP